MIPKDEGATAATPTKDPPPSQSTSGAARSLNLPPNPMTGAPSVEKVAPSGGGEDSSSPEVSGEMSRRAAIRQPVLRKRRMNFN